MQLQTLAFMVSPLHGAHSFHLGKYGVQSGGSLALLVARMQDFYSTPLAEQLWDCLVVKPVHPADVAQGLCFMMEGVAQDSFFDKDTEVGG